MKQDYTKYKLVSGLYRQACQLIKEGFPEKAERLVGEIADYGYFNEPTEIFMLTGNLEMVRKLKTAQAKQFSEECMHISEARCYSTAGMIEEHGIAMAKYEFEYNAKYRKRLTS
jgi:hypothetical protein